MQSVFVAGKKAKEVQPRWKADGGCDGCHYDGREGNGRKAGFEGGYYQEIFPKGIHTDADAAGYHKAFGELVSKADTGKGTVNCCHGKFIFDKIFGLVKIAIVLLLTKEINYLPKKEFFLSDSKYIKNIEKGESAFP